MAPTARGKDAKNKKEKDSKQTNRNKLPTASGKFGKSQFLICAVAIVVGNLGAWYYHQNNAVGKQVPSMPDLELPDALLEYPGTVPEPYTADVVRPWLVSQPFYASVQSAINTKFNSSALYVQSCRMDHIHIFSLWLESLGFEQLEIPALCRPDSLTQEKLAPLVKGLLGRIETFKGLLVVNQYGRDCSQTGPCAPSAIRSDSVLCLCRPEVLHFTKEQQHSAYGTFDKYVEELETKGKIEKISEPELALLKAQQKGVRSDVFYPQTFLLKSEEDMAGLDMVTEVMDGHEKFFVKPGAGLHGKGAEPLSSVKKLKEWMEKLTFPTKPYLIQRLIERPLLLNGRFCVWRTYAVVVRLSPLLVLWHPGRMSTGAYKFHDGSISDRERYVTNAGAVGLKGSILMPARKVLENIPAAHRQKLEDLALTTTKYVVSSSLLQVASLQKDAAEWPRSVIHLCVDIAFEGNDARVLEMNSDCGLMQLRPEQSRGLAEDLMVDYGILSLGLGLQAQMDSFDGAIPSGNWSVLLDLSSDVK